MGHYFVLVMDGADPLPSRLDQILGPIDEGDVAVRRNRGHVARPQPAVLRERLARPGIVVIVPGDPRPTGLKLTARYPVPGQLVDRTRLHDADLDARNG